MSDPEPPGRDQPTVLVVEDEEDLRVLLELNLGMSGYRVALASDGPEALAMIHDVAPDVVLLDVMMPTLDGWQVLHALKDDPRTSDIPVVMVTARTAEQDIIRGHLEGAVQYVTKPFDLQKLLDVVAGAVEPPDEAEQQRRRQMVRSLLQRLAELDAGRAPGTVVHNSRLESVARHAPTTSAAPDDRRRLERLTPKQRQIAAAFGAGRSARELAEGMGVSRTNVYAMRKRIARKLGVSPDEVPAEARRLGL